MTLIDVHHHPTLTSLVRRHERAGIPVFRGGPPWDPDIAVERMSITGTDLSVLSVPADLSWAGRDLDGAARDANDELAGIIEAAPTRFGAFATLPLPDVEATLRLCEEVLAGGLFDGVTMLTSYQGRYLADEEFQPLLELLDARAAVVFLHPILVFDAPAGLPGPLLEGTFDTTRAITALAARDLFTRYPNIRFIVPHAGAMVPYSKWRIALNAIQRGDWTIEPTAEQLETEIRKLDGLYYDTTLNLGPLLTLERPDRLLFGTDVPWAPTSILRMERDYATRVRDGWGQAEVDAVSSGNALRLLPNAARRLAGGRGE